MQTVLKFLCGCYIFKKRKAGKLETQESNPSKLLAVNPNDIQNQETTRIQKQRKTLEKIPTETEVTETSKVEVVLVNQGSDAETDTSKSGSKDESPVKKFEEFSAENLQYGTKLLNRTLLDSHDIRGIFS